MLAFVNRHRKLLTILILGLGLVWIAVSAKGHIFPGNNPAPRRGFLAPDFSLVNLDGEKVRLEDFHGQPVIVNFWASWCPPCRAEMPTFQKIYTEYKAQGLVILGVNSLESRSTAVDFAQSHALTFPILLDEDGTVSNRYRADSLPTTLFIRKNGIISEVMYGGPLSEALLRIQVDNLLEANP